MNDLRVVEIKPIADDVYSVVVVKDGDTYYLEYSIDDNEFSFFDDLKIKDLILLENIVKNFLKEGDV